MSRPTTIYVDLERLEAAGKASLIIRLMMACNDISLANQCLSKFKEEPRTRKHIQRGAEMYFVRLQCGHLKEGIELIREIRDDKTLYETVKRCYPSAKDSFAKLANCLPGGPDHQRFEQYVGRIRHQTVFHYDNKLVLRALSDRASRPEARRSKITAGSDMSLWRFELADDIQDSIACRQIWRIPRNADLRKCADECLHFGADLCKSFLDFCGDFILRYITEHAQV